MDLASICNKTMDMLKKYRYAVLVLIIGFVLMALPANQSSKKEVLSTPATTQETLSVNEALAQILSKIDGAGNVQVLLTIAAGEETVYQTDNNLSVTEDNSTTRIDTITITDANRNQTGLIKQINPPIYQGAVIVCQGADSAVVRLAIVDAVSKVTGLSSNHISVLKMK